MASDGIKEELLRSTKEGLMGWSVVVAAVLLVLTVLFFLWRKVSRKGDTILFAGMTNSGKTSLFVKLVNSGE